MTSRLRAGLLLVLVFLAGAGVGVLGLRVLGPRMWRGGRPGPDRVIEGLSRHLNLRPAQRDSVRAIFERRRPQLDSLWGAFRPRIDSLQRAIGREIEAQLDPDQRTKFAELRRRFDQRRGDHASPPPPMPE